jgi:tetratricopeptide (TPR) repeat protein
MKRTVSWATIAMLMTLLGNCGKPKPVPIEITFIKDFDQAKALALQSNKPIIIDFYTDWCKWCSVLDTTTLADSQVIAMSEDYFFVKINAETDSELAQSYGVQGYPTIVVTKSNGEEIDQIRGYATPADFRGRVEAYLQGKGTLEDYLARSQADSNNLDYLMAISEKYASRSQYDKAIEYGRKVVELDPDNEKNYAGMALAGIGNIQGQAKDFAVAIETFTEIINRYPDSPEADDATAMLGYYTFKQGDPKGALDLYRDYLAKYPSGRNQWVHARVADLEEIL